MVENNKNKGTNIYKKIINGGANENLFKNPMKWTELNSKLVKIQLNFINYFN